MKDTIEIRPWSIRDEGQMRLLIRGFLRNQLRFGGDILDTMYNVKWFWDFGLECSKAGEPTYVTVQRDKVLGYIHIGPYLTNLELKHRTCMAYGLYMLPSQEKNFLGVEMIRKAMYEVGKCGYERGITPILAMNRKMLEIACIGEAWPYQVHFQWFTNFAEHDTAIGRASKSEVGLGV